MKNRAVVFIKPHAMTEQTIRFVEKFLRDRGIRILSSGELSAETIDSEGIVDRHYFAIAKTAMEKTPEAYPIQDEAKGKFQEAFGESWEAAIGAGKVHNSRELMSELGLKKGKDLQELWLAGKQAKLGPGFYAGKLSGRDLYVINGFYPAMREKFTTPGEKIRWYTVEFDPDQVSWKAFRGRIIGATDPGKAEKGSLRYELRERYQELGQSIEPSMSDNGIHASAGPIEGLRELMVWTGADPFGEEAAKALTAQATGRERLSRWLENEPAVVNGKTGPVFDLTEDMDARDVVTALKDQA